MSKIYNYIKNVSAITIKINFDDNKNIYFWGNNKKVS